MYAPKTHTEGSFVIAPSIREAASLELDVFAFDLTGTTREVVILQTTVFHDN